MTNVPALEPPADAAPAVQYHAELVHATRGRIRLKLPTDKRDPGLLHQIKAAFEGIAGIDSIEVKPSSGSVIIYYDPDHHPDIPSLFASMGKTAAAPALPRSVPSTQQAPKTRLDDGLQYD